MLKIIPKVTGTFIKNKSKVYKGTNKNAQLIDEKKQSYNIFRMGFLLIPLNSYRSSNIYIIS